MMKWFPWTSMPLTLNMPKEGTPVKSNRSAFVKKEGVVLWGSTSESVGTEIKVPKR